MGILRIGTEFAGRLCAMREIVHTDYEGRPCPNDNDDCMLCNLEAPVVRSGGEPTVGGFRFALDRACYIAQPSVLAKELALLNYGCNEPNKVGVVAERLTTEIAEVLDDGGLAPTRN